MVEASKNLVPLTSDNERGFVRERGLHGVECGQFEFAFHLGICYLSWWVLIQRLLGLCVLHFVDISQCVLFRQRIFYLAGWVSCSIKFPCASVFVRGCVCVCVGVRAPLVSDMPSKYLFLELWFAITSPPLAED